MAAKNATPKPPGRRERVKAKKVVEEKVRRIGRRTKAELAAELREMVREYERNPADAPSLAAAESDLMGLLLLVGNLFVRTYYPAARSAMFCVADAFGAARTDMSMIYVPVHDPEPEGGGR